MVVVRQVPMIGRAVQLTRLVEFARLAVAGRGAAVSIEGEPGIGKTTLLDALAAEATRLGMRVRRAAAEESTRQVPFATLAACLGPAADADWRLGGDRGLGETAPASLEFACAEAIIAALEQWCAVAPVLLLLDDLHWVDAPSLRVLRRVGRMLAQLPLLLVGTCRPAGSAQQPATALPMVGVSGAFRLDRLTEADVDEAVTGMVGGRPGPRLRAAVAPAAGNPLHLIELVSVFARRPGIRVVAGIAEPSGPVGPVPTALPDAIRDRAGLLSAPAQQLLRAAAVLGPGFELAQLAALLGRTRSEMLPAVREGMDAGLLGGIAGRLTFRPEAARQALVDALPPDRRATLHRAAARALIATGARAERVAAHLLAGDMLDQDAVGWLRANMDPLIARAPVLAVELLRRVLAVAPPDHDEQTEALRSGHVRALLMAGRPAEAERIARSWLAGDGPAGGVALRWLLAHACLQQGRPDTALVEAQQALAGPDVPAGAAARLHGISAQSLFLLGRLVEAEAAAGLALAAGANRRQPAGVGAPTGGPAYVPHRHPAAALEDTDHALAGLSLGSMLPDQRTALLLTRGCCLEDLDRLEEADREFEHGRRVAERADTTFLVWFHVSRARLWFFEGRWDDALAEIDAGREPADPLGLAPALDSLAAMVAVHRGEMPTLPAQTGGTAARCFDHLRRWVGALVAEAEGHPDRALDLLADSWDRGRASAPPALPHRLCPDLARLAVTLGDVPRAREVAAGMARFAEQRGTVSARGTAELCHGLAESDPDGLLAAADSFRIAGRPLFRAYALENATVVLAQRGSARAARETLDTALEQYGRLGAGWDAARAEGRAQEAGVSPAEFGLPSRPRTGWAALTGTERAVAALVADGRANPDIGAQLSRSRRTVQWHVSSILAKLDLGSRAELATAVSRRRRTTAR